MTESAPTLWELQRQIGDLKPSEELLFERRGFKWKIHRQPAVTEEYRIAARKKGERCYHRVADFVLVGDLIRFLFGPPLFCVCEVDSK